MAASVGPSLAPGYQPEWMTRFAEFVAASPPRLRGAEAAFGLLVLGSPDPTRYSADMGTDFLARIGDVAAAALSRLRPGT